MQPIQVEVRGRAVSYKERMARAGSPITSHVSGPGAELELAQFNTHQRTCDELADSLTAAGANDMPTGFGACLQDFRMTSHWAKCRTTWSRNSRRD